MKKFIPLLMICGLLSCMATAEMAAYRLGLKKLPSGGETRIGMKSVLGLMPLTAVAEETPAPIPPEPPGECTLTSPSAVKTLVASTSLEFAYAQGNYFYHLTLPDFEGYYHIHRYDKALSALGLDLDIDMSGTATLDPVCLGATSTRYYVSAVGLRVWGDPPALQAVSEIRIYRDDGSSYSQFGKKEYQDMWGAGPVYFALDESGDRIYIYHQSEKKLYSTNLNGSDAISPKLSGVAVADVSNYVDKIDFYNGELFIYDYMNQMVYVHDPEDGSRIRSFSMASEGDAQYDYIGYKTVNGKVFFARDHNYDPPNEIKVFDLTGTYLGCIEMDSDLGPGYVEASSDYIYNFGSGIAEAYDILSFGE